MQTNRFHAILTTPVRLDYLLHRPAGAGPWPLVLFLHGAGERGADVAAVRAFGLPRTAGPDFPALLAAPQCPAGHTWLDHLPALAALLDDLQARYPIDPSRLLLTGLSMGGTGVLALAASHPGRFAGLVPICAGNKWYGLTIAEAVQPLRDLPIWVFHGDRDDVVPASHSIELVAALRAAGGTARLTLYPGVGHNSWDQAYADPELYSWLWKQRRPPTAGSPQAAG